MLKPDDAKVTQARVTIRPLTAESRSGLRRLLHPQKPLTWSPLQVGHSLPKFPLDLMPTWVQTFIRDGAAELQVSHDMLGAFVIGCWSIAATRVSEINMPGSNWIERPNQWMAVVSPSGYGKTPTENLACFPITEYVTALNKKEKSRYAEAQFELQQTRAKLEFEQNAAIEKGTIDDPATQTRLKLLHDRIQELEVQHVPQIITSDATPEGLGKIMSQNAGVMAILSDEGDEVFKNLLGHYGGKANLNLHLKAWSGESVTVNRATKGPIHIDHAYLSQCLAIQPAVLRDLGEKAVIRGRGFFGRHNFVRDPYQIEDRQGDAELMSSQVRDEYDTRLSTVLYAWHPDFLPILFDMGAAVSEWRELRAWAQDRVRERDPLLEEWLLKCPTVGARLAALFTLMEWDGTREAARWVMPISPDTMSQAARFVREYLYPHQQAAMREMTRQGDKARLHWERLLAKTRPETGHFLSLREATRSVHGTTADKARALMAMLVAHGYAKEADGGWSLRPLEEG